MRLLFARKGYLFVARVEWIKIEFCFNQISTRLLWYISSYEKASEQTSKQANMFLVPDSFWHKKQKGLTPTLGESRVWNHFNNWSINQSINQFTKTFYVSLRWSKFSDTFLIIGQSACRHLAHVHHSRLVVHKLRQNELMNPVNADWMLSKLDNSLIIASSVHLDFTTLVKLIGISLGT